MKFNLFRKIGEMPVIPVFLPAEFVYYAGMPRVLYDCDNTMGLEGRDVDDGLALLYLLGRREVDLLGVTTTFGNGSQEEVYRCTRQLFRELKLDSIPLHRGAASATRRESGAARFLVDSVRRFPGRVKILATGALTNLYGAWELDRGFFSCVEEIILMGGITEPLRINGRELAELNLSADPEAAYRVIQAPCRKTVITGNLCLQALLEQGAFTQVVERETAGIFPYLAERLRPWFSRMSQSFDLPGFHVWDGVAAVCITHPRLFEAREQPVFSSVEDLAGGRIVLEKEAGGTPHRGPKVGIPGRIRGMDRFWELLFGAWRNVAIRRTPGD